MEEAVSEKKKSIFTRWIKDNYDKVFIAVLVLAFLIRFWVFLKTLNQPLWWDAADYLTTAKRWAGFNLNNIWYYRRGFFWALFCAVFFKIGLGETTIRFTELLFSTGIVFVSYFLVKDMFNKKLALLTSISLTFSWIILFFSGRVLTDIPSAFFLLTSILFFWKGYVLKQGNKFLYLFAVFYAISVLTRMQYLMFAIPILIFIFTKEKFSMFKNKKLWLMLLIFILFLIPQIILYSSHYGNPITDIMSHYFGIGGETDTSYISRSLNYFFDLPYMIRGQQTSFLLSILSTVFFIAFILGVFYFFAELFLGFDRIFKEEIIQKKSFVFLWIVVSFFVLGYITLYVEQRYIIQSLPFIFLIVSSLILRLGEFSSENLKLSKKTTTVLITIFFLVLLIPNIFWAKSLIEAKSTSYLEVKQAGEWIKQNSLPEDIILSVSLPQTMYYSERKTYPFDIGSQDMCARDTALCNKYSEGEKGFEEFIKENKPKYLIVSAFEVHPDWTNSYINNNQQSLIPVQAYMQNQQPVLVIYQFKYS